MNKSLLSTILMALTIILPTKSWAQEPYAVLSDNNTVLTFYYDDHKAERNGMDVGPFTIHNSSEWYEQRESITNVVFDTSFANCTSLTSTAYWFRNCENMTTITGISNLKTDNVTDMGGMFDGCRALTSLDVSGFKTDNVTDMGGMFDGCRALTSLDVSGFKTDNVTNMSEMFTDCESLTSINVSNFKTDKVTYMVYMFTNCSALVSLDVSGFKTDNVTDLHGMFGYCESLTSIDVSNFKTDNVTNMSWMFVACSKLTRLDVSAFNTQNVTDMSAMFGGCSSLTTIYTGNDWTTVNVTNSEYMFLDCTNLVGGTGTRYDENHIDAAYAHIDGGTANPGYFTSKNSLVPVKDAEPYAVLSDNNTVLTFYYDDQKAARNGMSVEPHNVYFDDNSYYVECEWSNQKENITTVVFDSSFSNCTSLTSITHWFNSCWNLTSIININNLKTYNVTDMSGMFYGCTSLKNLDVSGFYTAKVKDMNEMFRDCSSLTSLDVSGFKTENVRNMGFMFNGCSNLTSLDMSGFSTTNVEYMAHMFRYCSSLTTIYVGDGWRTTKVTDSDLMFSECTSLVGGEGTQYDENHTDHTYAHIDEGTANPGYFTYKKASAPADNIIQFADPVMKGICVSNWDTDYDGELSYDEAAAVTDFGQLFRDNTNITSFNELQYFTGLTEIGELAFSGCESLSTIIIPNSITSIVGYAFQLCNSLTSINIPYSVNSIGGSAFHYCDRLVSINVDEGNPYFTSQDGVLFTKDIATIVRYPAGRPNNTYTIPNSVTTIGDNAFTKCENLTEIIFPNSLIGIGWSAFGGCRRLTSLTIPNSVQYIQMYAFGACDALTEVFSYIKNPFRIENEVFDTGKSDLTLYVPAGTKTLYETTDGWKNFMNIVEMKRFDGLTAWVSNETTLDDIFAEVGGREAASQTIAAIVWENSYALTADMLQGINNPNLLVYVNEPSLAPQGIQNVVVNGQAQEIVLTDAATGNNNWYCPEAFTAEKISYTRNFGQQTEVGVSRGWESIALPFTVQEITHESKGQITPFGANGTKHFWLRGYSPDGLYSAATLEANKPYVISMPNNTVVYPDAYNLNGRVTFSAENTTVPATPPLEEMMVVRDNIIMMPTFQYIPQNEYIYAVNVGQARERYAEGSVFARDLRDVRPFEAYTTHGERNGARPNFIRIAAQPSNESVGIRDIKTDSAESAWYSIDGRKLQGEPQRKGVYIQKGKKIRVK